MDSLLEWCGGVELACFDSVLACAGADDGGCCICADDVSVFGFVVVSGVGDGDGDGDAFGAEAGARAGASAGARDGDGDGDGDGDRDGDRDGRGLGEGWNCCLGCDCTIDCFDTGDVVDCCDDGAKLILRST